MLASIEPPNPLISSLQWAVTPSASSEDTFHPPPTSGHYMRTVLWVPPRPHMHTTSRSVAPAEAQNMKESVPPSCKLGKTDNVALEAVAGGDGG